MNRKPKIAQAGPYVFEAVEGKTYLWCACGRSFKQPFCDSSHAGSGFWPKRFRAEATGRLWLCGCKLTKRPPYCDGSHKHVDEVEEKVQPS